MKKLILLLFICITLTACSKPVDIRVKRMADAIVTWHEDYSFEDKNINGADRKLINSFKSNHNHDDWKINLTINTSFNEENKTNEKDTPGIFNENDQYYIKLSEITFFDDIHYDESLGKDITISKATIILNGYKTIILKDSFHKISELTDNTLYNFIYIGIKEGTNYYDVYYSSLQDNSLILQIRFTYNGNKIISIDTAYSYKKLEIIDEYHFTYQENPFPTIVLFIIITSMLVGATLLIMRVMRMNKS